MARRKGRPRGLAPARKEGPDRKSLVKYVESSGFFRLEKRGHWKSAARAGEQPLYASIVLSRQ